jgi:hypothetical protein
VEPRAVDAITATNESIGECLKEHNQGTLSHPGRMTRSWSNPLVAQRLNQYPALGRLEDHIHCE